MKEYKNIIFDLDGTLTNPYQGILNALRYALDKFGYSNLPEEVPGNFIGPPLQQCFKDNYGLNEKNTRVAVDYYREYYGEKGLYENEPYPGIQELLESLFGAGKQIFVATSKYKVFAWEIIKHFELDRYIGDLIGPEQNEDHTKAKLIQRILNNYSLDPMETVMIGDTHFDMIGAIESGIDCIAVNYGFGKAEKLQAFKPVAMADDVEELSGILHVSF